MALSNDFRAMVQDISASYDVRKGELSALRHQMHKMLDEFRKEKKEEFKKLGDERKKEISDIKQRVSDLKHDLRASLQEFRKTTFAEIHKGAEERKEEVSHALKTFRKEVLNTFRHEREDMASSWQELVASMKEKRAGKEPGHYEKTGPEKAVHEKRAHHKNRKAAKTRH
ncbi:MAG: hypothetical protein HYS21_02815 [Deltaproteobacteria bacterium]|nr:hypothetical protein [Deltaproteobacteria bacterium]